MESIIRWHSIGKEGFPKENGNYIVLNDDGSVEILYFANDTETHYSPKSRGWGYENTGHKHYTGFVWENDEGAIYEQTDVLYWAKLPDVKEESDEH